MSNSNYSHQLKQHQISELIALYAEFEKLSKSAAILTQKMKVFTQERIGEAQAARVIRGVGK